MGSAGVALEGNGRRGGVGQGRPSFEEECHFLISRRAQAALSTVTLKARNGSTNGEQPPADSPILIPHACLLSEEVIGVQHHIEGVHAVVIGVAVVVAILERREPEPVCQPR